MLPCPIGWVQLEMVLSAAQSSATMGSALEEGTLREGRAGEAQVLHRVTFGSGLCRGLPSSRSLSVIWILFPVALPDLLRAFFHFIGGGLTTGLA